MDFINLTEDNLSKEHLCCAIADKKHQVGVEEKKNCLKQRMAEGHVFRKLDVKGKVFIEYAPVETAWVPVIGNDYMYIYCLGYRDPLKGKVTVRCFWTIASMMPWKKEIPLNLVAVDNMEQAKAVPCVFNNWAVFYKRKFETVHLLNEGHLVKLLG